MQTLPESPLRCNRRKISFPVILSDLHLTLGHGSEEQGPAQLRAVQEGGVYEGRVGVLYIGPALKTLGTRWKAQPKNKNKICLEN